jgi:hypothetical protein
MVDYVLCVDSVLVVVNFSGLCTGRQMGNAIDYFTTANSYVRHLEQCCKLIHSVKENAHVKMSHYMSGGMRKIRTVIPHLAIRYINAADAIMDTFSFHITTLHVVRKTHVLSKIKKILLLGLWHGNMATTGVIS